MAIETLYIPEQYMLDVIRVIRAGLTVCPDVPEQVLEALERACSDYEAYLNGTKA